MALTATEGGVKLALARGVFYNTHMELCRDLSSLCVGALPGRLTAVDAMCASGVRGIRYKKENKNVASVALVDVDGKAVSCARKNATLNKLGGSFRCVKSDANKFLPANRFDIVELDPFGSPAPFLHDAARCLSANRGGYLSLTATDVAVLCGAHHAACLKNYGAAPLNNEFCHENAARILAAKTILTLAPFNLAALPIFTFSHRHYVKMIFSVETGADAAVAAVKQLGFVSYCPSCTWREAARMPRHLSCPHCSHQIENGGPLFIGKLWDEKVLGKMLALNVKRKYAKKKEIEKILSTMIAESAIPSYGYYDLHTLAKKMGGAILGMDDAVEKLQKTGAAVSRTHFCPTAVRTDASHETVLKVLSK
ncbi:tRNA (guanine(26)-N(2))-dimethyltransferase [uncultured archaeon]|nr:tRNA (guanine(26)-N(2))-dimethyltransferase [uncultured archaeon]